MNWLQPWAPSATRCSRVWGGGIAGSTRTRNIIRMARRELSFVCQNCGAAYGRWQGKCDACGEGNTMAEESAATARPALPGRAPRKGRVFALEPLAGEAHDAPRLPSGL